MRFILLSILLLLSAVQAGSNPVDTLNILATEDGQVKKVYTMGGTPLKVGDLLDANQWLFTLKLNDGSFSFINQNPGQVAFISDKLVKFGEVKKGDLLVKVISTPLVIKSEAREKASSSLNIGDMISKLWESTGVYALIDQGKHAWNEGFGRILMIIVSLLLLYLGIAKGFEPLLLIPISVGALLSNIPMAYISEPGGVLHHVYSIGIETGVFPLIIFMGVGAMTDFGPLLANPKTALLGGAAQVGIFGTLVGAVLLSKYIPGIEFDLKDAASISIIGGADGPTSIFVASKLSPALLGSIAVAAYSYMALVPIIQPPIMKALTSSEERKIKMVQLRYVSKAEKIIFPLVVIITCGLLLPSAAPLIGFLMFGNLIKECGVTERLNHTAQNTLINIVTIFLGLGVGSKLSADKFLNIETLGIVVLGLVAFCAGTAGGVLMAKFMNLFVKQKINPLLGSAGVSAVPMAARVANKVGLDEDPSNFLLMHAMGPNVAGVIGSAVAAGILLAVF